MTPPRGLVRESGVLATSRLGGDADSGDDCDDPSGSLQRRQEHQADRSDFVFDEANNRYSCPNGKHLTPRRRNFKKARGLVTKAGYIIYRASKHDCTDCPLKQRCCPNTDIRKVPRHVHEAAREVARQVAQRPDYRVTRRQRKKVEILFAHMKRILKTDRADLRHDSFDNACDASQRSCLDKLKAGRF